MLDRKNSKGGVRWSLQGAPCDEATRGLRNRILAFTLQALRTHKEYGTIVHLFILGRKW